MTACNFRQSFSMSITASGSIDDESCDFGRGLGSRLSEETDTKPKPMVEIGGRPILWHIMQIFSAYGVSDFVICLGYKGYIIKEYFLNYRLHLSDVTVNIVNGAIDYHRSGAEDWRVSLIETGDATMTAAASRGFETI